MAGTDANAVAKLQQLEAAEIVFRLARGGKLTTDLQRKAVRMFVEDGFVVKAAASSICQALVAAGDIDTVMDALPKETAETFLLALSFMDRPDECRVMQFGEIVLPTHLSGTGPRSRSAVLRT